jgi:hypothetical protein
MRKKGKGVVVMAEIPVSSDMVEKQKIIKGPLEILGKNL